MRSEEGDGIGLLCCFCGDIMRKLGCNHKDRMEFMDVKLLENI